MPLTNEELAEVDKLLGRMEKNAKKWRVQRWISMVIALLILGMGCWTIMLAMTVLPKNPDDPFKTVTHLDLANDRMWLSIFCSGLVNGMIVTLTGVGGLIYTLGNWNKGKKDRLLAKLARSYVESLRSGNESCP